MKFGIEIEAKGISLNQVASLLTNAGIQCTNEGYTHRVLSNWKVVTDSSVHGGFELVSPPLEYNDENIELVRKVIELLNEAGCSVDKQCGLHVHMEVSHLTGQHVANIYNRYRKYETNFDALQPESRRANNNSMCQSLCGRPEVQAHDSVADVCAQRQDRYRKLNLASFVKYGTIEFRQHAGSLNKAKVSKWLKFLGQFIEASRPVELVANSTELTASGITGKSKRIVEMLTAQPYGVSATSLADTLGMTRASVQSAVCRLRRNNGVHISSGGSRYRLLAPATASTGTQVSTVDSFWKGIDQTTKTFYERRASALAS